MSSSSQPLNLGVPQGSILGSLIFTLHAAPIASIAQSHGLGGQLYTDDKQLYASFSSSEAVITVVRVDYCLVEIKAWQLADKLKFTDDKLV